MTRGSHMRSTTLVALLALTLPTLAAATTWHVPGDAPTIQAGIDSASVGDDVLVAPGTYFEHDIAMKAGIWVHSEHGPAATTVDATGDGVGFDCANLQQGTVVEGFTILNGFADGIGQDENSGGGVRCVGSRLEIRNCAITGCVADYGGGGIYAHDSEVDIEACRITNCSSSSGGGIWAADEQPVRISDCEILGNEATASGGILAWGSEVTIVRCVVSGNLARWGGAGGIGCISPSLTVRDCLITRNEAYDVAMGSGLGVQYSSGLIEGCTVAGNLAVPRLGAVYVGDLSEVEVSRTLVAFNDDRALGCAALQVTVRCCDLHGNAGGDDLCGTSLGGNFSADPLFCDAANNDYTLDACSPCLPGNHPDGVDCGLIGALGQGCGATAIEKTSCGRIKALYRR